MKNWFSSNKKTLIQLFCWLIFITILVIFVKNIDDKNTKEKENVDSKIEILNTMDNYIYECLYNDVRYNGRIYNDGREEMYVKEGEIVKSFYFENEWYQIIDEEQIPSEEYVSRLKPKDIYETIKRGNYIETVKENDFDKYRFEVNASYIGMESDKVFYVNVYFKDGEIKAADILGQYCLYNLVKGE